MPLFSLLFSSSKNANKQHKASEQTISVDFQKQDNLSVSNYLQDTQIYNQFRTNYKKNLRYQKYKGITISDKEELVNQQFVQRVKNLRKTLDDDFFHGYILKNKTFIENTLLYNLLRDMPKGVLHHQHLDCTFDLRWLVPLISNNNIVYVNPNNNCHLIVARNEKEFEKVQQKEDYILLREFVSDKKNRDRIDSLLTIGHNEVISKQNMWVAFNDRLDRLIPVLFNIEFFHDYIVNTCLDCVADGIDRLECRFLFGGIKNTEGNNLSFDEEIEIFQSAIESVQRRHPHFTFGIIAQGLKVLSIDQTTQYLYEVMKLKKKYPELILGFDLVQEEDTSPQLIDLMQIFVCKEVFQQELDVKIDLLLHGGESVTQANDNIIDCILLNVKRIGHGINLNRHPFLLDIIKQKEICLEINPLSNQLLQYHYDIRTHPLPMYLNYGIPVSISSDDPGYFGSHVVTFEYFVAALALELDLLDLKQCIYNSIQYSQQTELQKQQHLKQWNNKWDEFVDLLQNNHLQQ